MNVLAIETASDILHLALKTDTSYYSTTQTSSRKFSEKLIEQILELCSQGTIKVSDVDLIVCSRGPGSFTGLRIGMAVAKGLSVALGIPLTSISTLETYQHPLSCAPIPVMPVLDAKKGRFYVAVFHQGQRICEDSDASIEQIRSLVLPHDSLILTGVDAKRVMDLIKQTEKEITTSCILDPLTHRDYGESMIQLGIREFDRIGADPMNFGPIYIRKSDAEVSLEKRLQHL